MQPENGMSLGDNALDSDNLVVKNSKKPEEMKKVTKISKEDIQAELEKMKNERVVFQEEMKKKIGSVKTGVDERINTLAEKMEEQTSKVTIVREEAKEMKKKTLELENRKNDITNAVEAG